MRVIRYKQSEYLMPWKWRKKKPAYRFILEIPYGLYFSVVPGFDALNDLLQKGASGGGMGTGVYWKPFEIGEEEYLQITEAWRRFDLRKVLKFQVGDVTDLNFVFDDEILAISNYFDYLSGSREKYESRFWKQQVEKGMGR
ncbi:MAG: hypothetical protein AAF226_06475 [Verrucomicrobiota bacterium]